MLRPFLPINQKEFTESTRITKQNSFAAFQMQDEMRVFVDWMHAELAAQSA